MITLSAFLLNPLSSWGQVPPNPTPLPYFDKSFNVGYTGTAQWYSFNLKTGQGIAVILKANLNSGALNFCIYGPAGQQLACSDDSSLTNGQTGKREIVVQEDGIYYIQVWGTAAGNYDLAVYNAWFNAGIMDEPRGFYSTFDTAQYIQSKNYQRSAIKQEAFRFAAQQGAVVTVSVAAHLNSGALNFCMYDQNGVQIVCSNDSSITNGQTGIINGRVIALDGVYYIVVWGDGSGNYDLTITGAEADTDTDGDGLTDAAEYYRGTEVNITDTDLDGVSDFNELLNGKNPLVATEYECPEDPVCDAITRPLAFPLPIFDEKINVDYTGTAQWYSFNLKTGQGITAMVVAHLNTGGLNFCIYGPAGQQLACSSDTNLTNGQTGLRDLVVQEDGEYYIQVMGSAAGNYDLAVYNAWFNAGIIDEQRDFYSTYHTSQYIQSGAHDRSAIKQEVYRFAAQQGSVVTVSVAAHLNSGSLNFCMYGKGGVQIACSNDSAITNGQTGIISGRVIAADGEYYIVVTGDGAGYYDLTITGADECTVCLGIPGEVECSHCSEIVRDLIEYYYDAILDREPDVPGWYFWRYAIARIMNLGIYVGEGFQSLARAYFNDTEYLASGKNNTDFLVDVYQTFLLREPDPVGLDYWLQQLSLGLTRDMVITYFANSPEYKQILTNIFGTDETRAENNLVNDFYRGFYNRFPDISGFSYWLNEMREAQCTGPEAVKMVSSAIAFDFAHKPEYNSPTPPSNEQYVADLYNGILRRGADYIGFQFWVNCLDTGPCNRDGVLQSFIASPEFQKRAQAVIDEGCLP